MEHKKEYNEWRERINNYGFRFLIRDDIEQIIKKKNIDRNFFHEYSKIDFNKIIRKFYYTFSDIKNFPVKSEISLLYNSMHFRSDLKQEHIDCFLRTDDWCTYMKSIKDMIPNKEQKLFLILCEGWVVYEGRCNEIFEVLNEVTYIKDFYIVSSRFDWFVAVSDMEDNSIFYQL